MIIKKISKEFVLYFLLSFLAFGLDYTVLFLLTEFLHFSYLLSGACGFFVGVIVTYLGSIFLVFEERRIKNASLEFMIFALIGLVGLGLNHFFLWLFTEKIGLYYLISKFFSAGFIFISNFNLRKFFLFHKTPTAQETPLANGEEVFETDPTLAPLLKRSVSPS